VTRYNASPLSAEGGARPLGLLPTLLLYGAFGVELAIATYWGMPALQSLGVRADLSWFIAGAAVFATFAAFTVVLLRLEGPKARLNWRERLRVRPMTRADWKTAGIALAVAFGGPAVLLPIGQTLVPGFSPHPPFMTMEPLARSDYWVILAWLPMFVLNIAGEELFGRGYLLPRNELAAGRFGWLVNAAGWLLFHAAFGPILMVLTAPIIIAVCWAVQRSRNTTVGLLVHGLPNGLGFLAVSLGLMPA